VDPGGAGAWEIEPGLWQLRLPLPWDTIATVNAFAIALDDGIMLVDCGSAGDPTHRDALLAAMDAAGVSLADVRLLVGTHTHSDHVGLAEWVIAQSGCRFLMHPASAHFYDAMREPERIEAARSARATREGVPGPELALYGDVREETEGILAPVDPDEPLRDGARLASALGDWEVVETPGHAPSHVCLFQRERRLMISGDHLLGRISLYYDYGYSPDPAGEFLQSLERVEDLAPRLCLPGHGRTFNDVEAHIHANRRLVAERIQRVLDAIGVDPLTVVEIVPHVYGQAVTELTAHWWLSETLCYLQHLEMTGRAERVDGGDGVVERWSAA
jgi:glyoxylase-like metal-dependent hydrolase (beta-lactamase superfamily II)